ncbi:MAG: hypothetical protein GF419_11745 [Ignavibacteriales bacterium]|nr:hypothetical protein [Ignavibacteriales bacterium]
MPILTVNDHFSENPIILTEGDVADRLTREFMYKPDPYIGAAKMIEGFQEANALTKIYVQYLTVALRVNLPLLLFAPTLKTNKSNSEKAGYRLSDLNTEALHFMLRLKKDYAGAARNILVGAYIGPHGDPFKPEDAPEAKDALDLHGFQIKALKGAGAEFIYAKGFTSVEEATGVAKSIAQNKLPYFMSFIPKEDGTLLDGTTINDAMKRVDDEAPFAPMMFALANVHHSVFRKAMSAEANANDYVRKRLRGLQANVSAQPPEELADPTGGIESDDPDEWAQAMAALRNDFKLKLFGGAFGSNNQYFERLVDELKSRLISGVKR